MQLPFVHPRRERSQAVSCQHFQGKPWLALGETPGTGYLGLEALKAAEPLQKPFRQAEHSPSPEPGNP